MVIEMALMATTIVLLIAYLARNELETLGWIVLFYLAGVVVERAFSLWQTRRTSAV